MSTNSTSDLPGPADKRQSADTTDNEAPLADELSDQDLDKVSGGLGQPGKGHTGFDDLEQIP